MARSRRSSGVVAGIRSSSSATSLGLEHLRQVGVLLGARDQVGGIRLELAALDQVAVEAADRGQLAGDRRLRGAVLAEHGGEAAQVAVGHVLRARARAPPPTRRAARGRCRTRAASCRPFRAARCQSSNAGEGRRPTSLLRSGCRSSSTLEDGRVATRGQLAEAGLVDELEQAECALASDPGPGRRLDDVVRGPAQARAGRLHRHALLSTHRAARTSWRKRAGKRCRSPRSASAPTRCRSARRPEPGRRARSRPGSPSGCSRARRRARASRSRRCRGCRRRRRSPASAP